MTKKYLTCAETAKLMRGELKKNFPGIKFSVRSHVYAGGASIDVNWTDGPGAGAVDDIVRIFAGASFDGMIDLKSYHDTEWNGETVSMGADYVFTHREVGSAAEAAATEVALTRLDAPLDPEAAAYQWISGRQLSGWWYEGPFTGFVRVLAAEISEGLVDA